MASVNTGRKMNTDQIYQPGTNTLPMYADGLKQMAETEYNIVSPIFRRDEWEGVCAATMRQPIQEFADTLRDLNKHIQKNLQTDCFLAYEIIGIVSRLAIDLERFFDVKQPILDALRPIRDTAKASFTNLLGGIRDATGNLGALPPDGAAIPLVSDTMTKLQTMVRLLDPVQSVLRDLGDGGWSRLGSVALDVSPDGDQLFAKYAKDTIETLLNNLDNRARALLKYPAVQGVFMMNNIAIIERMISSSDLYPLLQDTVPPYLDPFKKRMAKRYSDEWQILCRLLFDTQTTRSMRPNSGSTDSASVVKSLSTKEKEAIKQKWTTFNKDFEELVQKHKGYAFEREVRGYFAKEIASLIEPMYRRFWDKYHEIDKGKGKYVKYDKGQMAGVLASLG